MAKVIIVCSTADWGLFPLDVYYMLSIQCFDTVGWATGRASGL